MSRSLQLALHFSLDNNVVVKRITGRLTCGKCGAIFNRFFSPPVKQGVCDQCGSKKLEHRSDDNEKALRARLEAYERDTSPLISYYRAQHKLRTIPASGDVAEIFAAICEVVDTEIRPLDKKVVVMQESQTQLRPLAERTDASKSRPSESDKVPAKKAAVNKKAAKKVTKKAAPKKASSQKKVTKKGASKKARARR